MVDEFILFFFYYLWGYDILLKISFLKRLTFYCFFIIVTGFCYFILSIASTHSIISCIQVHYVQKQTKYKKGKTGDFNISESFRRAPGEPGTVIPLEFQGGTTVILSCSSTGGNPPPLVVWLKDDIVISSGTNTSTSGNVPTTNLTLATTADDDLEVYECQADNGFLQRPLVKTTYLTLNRMYCHVLHIVLHKFL